jgi:hypothetical protein
MFGRVEVRLTKLGLQIGHSLGPVHLRRKRLFKSLERLAIIGTADSDGLATLMAYFSDQKPLMLARMFPRPMLDRVASDMVRAAARLGSGRKVSLHRADPSTKLCNMTSWIAGGWSAVHRADTVRWRDLGRHSPHWRFP